MTQILKAEIPVPNGFVLIEQSKMKELEEEYSTPVWDLNDLKKHLKIKSDEVIKDRLLFNYKLEKQLKKEGIAHYPNSDFNRWRFNARKMKKFIEEHFNEIYK